MKNKWVILAVFLLSSAGIRAENPGEITEEIAVEIVHSLANQPEEALEFLANVENFDDLTAKEKNILLKLVKEAQGRTRSAWALSKD